MNKLFIGIFCVGLLFSQSRYYGSTTAPVTIAGGIIKAKHYQEDAQKYKRKDCPVCKGKGWYMSGDGILKIDCTYCEPDDGSKTETKKIVNQSPKPPVIKYNKPYCRDGKCTVN